MAKIIIEDQNESLVPGDVHYQVEEREVFKSVPIIQSLPQDFKIASEFELVGGEEEKIVDQ